MIVWQIALYTLIAIGGFVLGLWLRMMWVRGEI